MSETPLDTSLLVGCWRLLDFTLTFDDGDSVLPIGENPFGLLIYTPTWMSAHLVAQGADRSYFSYCGPWRYQDGLLHHDVQSSDRPGWIGRTLVRGAAWQGAVLALTAKGARYEDRTGVGLLRWQREE